MTSSKHLCQTVSECPCPLHVILKCHLDLLHAQITLWLSLSQASQNPFRWESKWEGKAVRQLQSTLHGGKKHLSNKLSSMWHGKSPYLLTVSLQLNNIIERIIHKHTVCLLRKLIFHGKMLDGASDLRFSSVKRRPEAGADALSGDVHQHSGRNLQ